MIMTMSRPEQETSILGNVEDRTWDIVSADPKFIRLMARRGWKSKADPDGWGAVRWIVPLRAIAVRRVEKRAGNPNALATARKNRSKDGRSARKDTSA